MPPIDVPDGWLWNLAPIASIVTSCVLSYAAFTARQTYRRTNLDNSPDVSHAIGVSVGGRGSGPQRELSFVLSSGSKSEWEVTSLQLGERRRCLRRLLRRQQWEQHIPLRVASGSDTIVLPPDCPGYFPVTFHIRRVSHYHEQSTLEAWCGGQRNSTPASVHSSQASPPPPAPPPPAPLGVRRVP